MIELLRHLTALAWRDRLDPAVYKMARELTDREATRQQKVEAIVDSLHRRFQLARTDASEEETLASPAQLLAAQRGALDADDACAIVAALAMSVGIRCRLVAVRYGYSWTCWVSYEVGDHWETCDPLRQHPEHEPDQTVTGPIPGEGGG